MLCPGKMNRGKPPLKFRSQGHTKKDRNSKSKSEIDFQNDLDSQQATVELQILMAYQDTEFLKENPNLISRDTKRMSMPKRKPEFDFRNDFESQQGFRSRWHAKIYTF